MPPQIKLNRQLALFQFLLSKFGFNSFDEVQRKFADNELDDAEPENSIFYTNLAPKVDFSIEKLHQYDTNIINHLRTLNTRRPIPIRLKYYQYFSLLFTEYYLDNFYTDKYALKNELNDFTGNSSVSTIRELPEFMVNDLNKLAYWNATGSGKTFIMHINVLQFRHYARLHDLNYTNLILLTPSEDLTKQHLEELEKSNIPAVYYGDDKESPAVKVIDINKIREFSSGKGVTFPLFEFNTNNAIFVDEGHKGDSKEDSVWRNARETLSRRGFAFEYSATFGQLKNRDLLKEYGKCIAFDYSYGHFYEDGYGKDYWIHNLSYSEPNRQREVNAILDNTQTKFQYLLQNLLLFVQQKQYFTTNRDILQPYQIENPLLIFVGSSVEPKPTSASQRNENNNVISDVKTVLDFFNDFLQNRPKYIDWINKLRLNKEEALFKEDYYSKLTYLFSALPNASSIYDFILRLAFNTNTADKLELFSIRNAVGEIALKVRNADHYFALIYIGDTASFRAPLEQNHAYTFKKDVINNSLFKTLSDKQSNPVNILIGARKFIEGWNNYRVSSIGLINFGRAKGSQIIQLFGRGVRLMGKENSLKRSSGSPDAPKDIHIVETLNIFGLRADYMKQFKEDLEKEGVKTLKKSFSFDVVVTHNLGDIKLATLERDNSVSPFEDTQILKLKAVPNISVTVDIASKKFVGISGQTTAAQTIPVQGRKIPDDALAFVDWKYVYSTLLRYKTLKTNPLMRNLLIPYHRLKDLFHQINYKIKADHHPISVKSLEDVEKVNKLVLQVLTKYMVIFFNRYKQNYEGKNLRASVLSGDNANIANATWYFEIITTDIQGNDLQDIENTLNRISELSDTSENYPDKIKDNELLKNTWLDAHIYQPLFKDSGNQTLAIAGTRIVDSIKPPGLNLGEFTFVEDLKNFISSQQTRYPDYDFYLLRNLSRGKGFGFYFQASGGFFPDFMFWLKHKTNGKQYLTFIDPHGLRNETQGWDSPKIKLYESIKTLETQLGNPNLILNSFILQPPPNNLEQTGLNNWHREDDPMRTVPLNDYAARHHVYYIPEQGNKAGLGGYIDKMVQQIITTE